MKGLIEYINEASRNDMFVGLTSKRNTEEPIFQKGEKVLVMKCSEWGYDANPFGVAEIVKVNKKSMVIKGINSTIDEFKFDEKGICVKITKNTYLGKFKEYWVLYNRTLVEEPEFQELLNTGINMWGFKLSQDRAKVTKEYISEL